MSDRVTGSDTGGNPARAMGPSIWAASDGKAGNEAQVMAIARALGETGRWMRVAHIRGEAPRRDPIRLHPSGPQTLLPAHRWPAPLRALPDADRDVFQPPWPTLWIGAGRRTAPYSLAMRGWSGGKTFVVHMLDPKVDPARFDLLITPAHDQTEGDNVLTTLGSPTYFAPEAIEDAELNFGNLVDEPGTACVVVIGGNSKAHTMTRDSVDRLIGQLRQLSLAGHRLRITCSRRTPDEARIKFRAVADEIGGAFWDGPQDGPNPYLAWLLFSRLAIITEDSANMLSDAAYFGLPIHIARLDGRSDKFDRLHTSLIERGAARWFTGEVEHWSYTPIREIDRIADVIIDRLIQRHPQPVHGPSGGQAG